MGRGRYRVRSPLRGTPNKGVERRGKDRLRQKEQAGVRKDPRIKLVCFRHHRRRSKKAHPLRHVGAMRKGRSYHRARTNTNIPKVQKKVSNRLYLNFLRWLGRDLWQTRSRHSPPTPVRSRTYGTGNYDPNDTSGPSTQ